MSLYNLRSHGSAFVIAKFDDDLEIVVDKDGRLSIYQLTFPDGDLACDCPAGHRPTCRHRQMYPILRNRVDTAWFYDFETARWSDPTGAAQAEPEPLTIAYEITLPVDATPQQVAEEFSKLRQPPPVFNPTAGIPKASYGPKDSPSYDKATWFSTVQPPTVEPKPAKPWRRF